MLEHEWWYEIYKLQKPGCIIVHPGFCTRSKTTSLIKSCLHRAVFGPAGWFALFAEAGIF